MLHALHRPDRLLLALLLLLPCARSPLSAQASGGIVFHPGGDAVAVQLTGRLQYDSRIFLDDGAATSDAILLRRAVPGVQVTLFRDFAARFTADVSEGRPEPLEAWGSAQLVPAVQLRVGKILVPLGLAQLQGISNGALAEHGLGSQLAPARDVGVELRGTVAGVADYSLGIYNGVADGVNGEVDWSGAKDFVARGFLRPFARRADHRLQRLGFGLGASSGVHRGTADAPYLPGYRTGARERFFGYRGGDTPTLADGIHRRYSPQAYLYTGRLGLLGEYLVTSGEVRREADAARLTSRAWQGIVSWVLTGEDASYTGVVPATRLDPRAGTWGAVELALRLDGFQADGDAFPRFSDPGRAAASAHAVTGGINWYPNRNLRLLVNYELTRFGAAPGAEARPSERALITRLQLGL